MTHLDVEGFSLDEIAALASAVHIAIRRSRVATEHECLSLEDAVLWAARSGHARRLDGRLDPAALAEAARERSRVDFH